jgi:ABC-type multidrug transport system ATPase subunit
VGPGDVLGLVGPNGSGKTTLLRVLATLDPPTSGCVRWFGMADRRSGAVRRRLGTALDTPVHLDALTGSQNAELFAALYGVPGGRRAERLAELFAWAGLWEARNRRVAEYSLGMRRRLSLVEALCPDPDLLVLDEPTLALDEHGELDLEQRLAEVTERGAAVVLATNDRRFAETVCTQQVELPEGHGLTGRVVA